MHQFGWCAELQQPVRKLSGKGGGSIFRPHLFLPKCLYPLHYLPWTGESIGIGKAGFTDISGGCIGSGAAGFTDIFGGSCAPVGSTDVVSSGFTVSLQPLILATATNDTANAANLIL